MAWNVSREDLLRNFFAEELKQEGIDYKDIKKFTYKDDQGLYGEKSTKYEVYIVAKNNKVYLIEVKSHGEILTGLI